MKSWVRISLGAGVMVAVMAISSPGVSRGALQEPAQKSQDESAKPAHSAEPVPPYFKTARAAKPLPPVLPASRFAGHPVVVRAYEIAARIPKLLAQEPCYCGCNMHFGHRSLLDCYATDHTAGCAICVKEAFFVYQMHKQGKTAAQIRQAIIRGDWKNVDLEHPPAL